MVTFTQIREYVESKDWDSLTKAYTEAKSLGFNPPLDARNAERIRNLMLEAALFSPDGSHGFPRVLLNALDDTENRQQPQKQESVEVGIEPKKPESSIFFAHSETGWIEFGTQTPLDWVFLVGALHETRKNHAYATDEEGLVTAIDLAGGIIEWLNECCNAFGVLLAETDPKDVLRGDMCNIGWTIASLNALACHVQTACAGMQFALGKMTKKEAAK